jgi:hypothetical protein
LLPVARALAAGSSPAEIVGILTAIAPNVGIPKVVDATPRIAAALDIDLDLTSSDDTDTDAGGTGTGGTGSAS